MRTGEAVLTGAALCEAFDVRIFSGAVTAFAVEDRLGGGALIISSAAGPVAQPAGALDSMTRQIADASRSGVATLRVWRGLYNNDAPIRSVRLILIQLPPNPDY